MGFKMKGNPFKLGRVATKSGMQMAKRAMKMKPKSPMARLDYEYDGEIIDKVTYDKKMDEAKRLKDIKGGGDGTGRDLDGSSGIIDGEYQDVTEGVKKIREFIPDFMTEEEFKKANPDGLYGSADPEVNPYMKYVNEAEAKVRELAAKKLQDEYAPREGSVTGEVGFSGKLKATGQDFIDELYEQFKEQGPMEDYEGNKITFQQYVDNEGLREQYQNAIRERNANKQ